MAVVPHLSFEALVPDLYAGPVPGPGPGHRPQGQDVAQELSVEAGLHRERSDVIIVIIMTRAWLGGSQYTSRLVLRVEILLRRNTGAALGPDTATVNRTICILVMFNVNGLPSN